MKVISIEIEYKNNELRLLFDYRGDDKKFWRADESRSKVVAKAMSDDSHLRWTGCWGVRVSGFRGVGVSECRVSRYWGVRVSGIGVSGCRGVGV